MLTRAWTGGGLAVACFLELRAVVLHSTAHGVLYSSYFADADSGSCLRPTKHEGPEPISPESLDPEPISHEPCQTWKLFVKGLMTVCGFEYLAREGRGFRVLAMCGTVSGKGNPNPVEPIAVGPEASDPENVRSLDPSFSLALQTSP